MHGLSEGGASMSGRRAWSAPFALFVAVAGIALAVGFAVRGGASTAAGSATVSGLECPPGSNTSSTQFDWTEEGIAASPDSPEEVLVKVALDRAAQMPTGKVQRDDVRAENFKKVKKMESEGESGPGTYVLISDQQVVAEFTVAETVVDGRLKFYVDTLSTCA
jgi:hypothetical protein